MDDNAPKENPPPDFNKLDLSQLQGFSFGTQWTQEKPSAPDQRRDRGDSGDRPRRDDRRDGPGGPDRRDRRTFRRPAGAPGEGGPGGAAPAGGGGAPTERREFPGDRRPRQGGDYRGGGPRREGGYGGGERGPRYGGGYGGRPMQDRGPYDSPYYSVTFYPEDSSFNTLVQTIRKSCRTVELFEIARTVVAKNDRFVVVMTHKPAAEPAVRPAAPAAGTAAPEAAPAPKPKPVFHVSVPDGIPFESDEAAVAHVLSKHLDKFFDTADVEVEPPKGNFQVINKCGVTGELLGPPNYHRYNQIVQQHYAAKAARMPFEAFRSRIETIRDPEVVNQWLAKMKKATRYTWKFGRPAEPAAPAPAPAPAAATEPAPADTAPGAEGAPAEAAAPATPPPNTTPTFDTLEDARLHLLTHARDKVVRTTENARFHGKVLESMPPGEIRRSVEGALERQRRFPLDTANALRGRLRREHFTIFKKGSKGISYVCAVKRKFRVPGQTFADSIGALISFIEANPMIRASELAPKFLGLAQRPAPKPAEATPPAAPAAGTEGAVAEAPAAAPAPAPAAEPSLSIDDRARLARMQNDLAWLVREGYVTEFIDGRLFAPPPMVEARKKEIESEEHDPENFPEVPASVAAGTQPPASGETSGSGEPASSDSAPSEDSGVNADSAPETPAEPPAEPKSETAAESVEPAAEHKSEGASEPAEPAAVPNSEEAAKRNEA